MTVKVALPASVPISDLAMGLCLVVGRHDMKQPEIRAMHEALQKFDHETLYAGASLVAESNGRKLAAEHMTFENIVRNGSPDCMMINRPGDKAVCACMCRGELICPNPKLAPDNGQKLIVILPVNQTVTVTA